MKYFFRLAVLAGLALTARGAPVSASGAFGLCYDPTNHCCAGCPRPWNAFSALCCAPGTGHPNDPGPMPCLPYQGPGYPHGPNPGLFGGHGLGRGDDDCGDGSCGSHGKHFRGLCGSHGCGRLGHFGLNLFHKHCGVAAYDYDLGCSTGGCATGSCGAAPAGGHHAPIATPAKLPPTVNPVSYQMAYPAYYPVQYPQWMPGAAPYWGFGNATPGYYGTWPNGF